MGDEGFVFSMIFSSAASCFLRSFSWSEAKTRTEVDVKGSLMEEGESTREVSDEEETTLVAGGSSCEALRRRFFESSRPR